MTQATIFDAIEARAARDAAIERAATGAGDDWIGEAIECIERVARACAEFTTDDVWRAGLRAPPGGEPRALGAAMTAARRARLCERTNRTRCTDRVVAHRRPATIWRSLVCGAEKLSRAS